MRRSCLALSFALSAVVAQQPVPAKAFLLDDFKNVVFADLAALRERGIWADLEISVLKVVFEQMQKEIGFPLLALDRVTMVADFGAEGEQAEGMQRNVREVLVFEGNRPLGIPDSIARGRWTQGTVGKFEVRRREPGGETFVQPRPELQVRGASSVIEPVLDGKPHAGLPCADVMSLLSGRGDNLVYFSFDVANALLRNSALGVLFPGTEWPEGDAPTFLFCRVRATGVADDPHLEVEAVLRHQKEGEGIAVSDAAVDAWIERMKKEPTMRAVRPLFQRLEKRHDRGDLCLRVDLGRTREAVGHLATLAMPILAPRAAQQAQAVGAPPPPAPPEPKKQAP